MECQALARMLMALTVVLVACMAVQVNGYNLIARRQAEISGDVVVARRRRNANNEVMTPPAKIVSMNIESKTSSRFTQVLVESLVANKEREPTEAKFQVQIPETAFMTNFSMLINGSWLSGQVLEKSEAEDVYRDARSRGESAGHVGANSRVPAPRGMDIFDISVSVAAESDVEFQLLYCELLERRLGVYQQRISIRPGQIVDQLSLSAELYEPQGFDTFKFSPPGESALLESSRQRDIIVTASNTFKSVQYSMSVAAQKSMNSETGSDGDFVIEYDVSRQNVEITGGLLLVENGYFVHYISPSDPSLESLSKTIAFIIDVSGSMSGQKIAQTRQALKEILSQLQAHDFFIILLFSSEVKPWKSHPVAGTAENIAMAKRFVDDSVKAAGATNINDALKEGGKLLSLLQTGLSEQRGRMIVFLTDGMPSSGVTNLKLIRENTLTWNSESRIPIFSLGFGEGVRFDFLEQLSWENYGFARKIYEDTDGASQLSNFFAEVESVLLLNVQVTYDLNAVSISSLTSRDFPQYFKGTELIVAGEVKPSAPASWSAHVTADGNSGAVNYEVPVSTQNMYTYTTAPWSAGFAEKLRAYLKIKDLVRAMSIESNETRKAALKQAAIDLSLQYHFVTPVTSMVVTQLVSAERRVDMSDESSLRLKPVGGFEKFRPAYYSRNGVLTLRSFTCIIIFIPLISTWVNA